MSSPDITLERLRRLLARKKRVSEKRMIGGICFMVDGKMACGVNAAGLLVRVGAEARAKFLKAPHVKPMRFAGKTLSAYILVEPAGIRTEAALKKWLQRGLEYAGKPSRPRKPAIRRKKR